MIYSEVGDLMGHGCQGWSRGNFRVCYFCCPHGLQVCLFFCGLEKEVDLCEDINFGIGLLHKCCELWRSKTAKTEGDSSSVSHFLPES